MVNYFWVLRCFYIDSLRDSKHCLVSGARQRHRWDLEPVTVLFQCQTILWEGPLLELPYVICLGHSRWVSCRIFFFSFISDQLIVEIALVQGAEHYWGKVVEGRWFTKSFLDARSHSLITILRILLLAKCWGNLLSDTSGGLSCRQSLICNDWSERKQKESCLDFITTGFIVVLDVHLM